MKKTNIAKVLMAVAMFIFSTLAPFVRKINVSSGELALYRAVLAAVLVGGFLLITKQKLPIGSIKKELLLLLLSGAAMGVNWILLFEAYKTKFLIGKLSSFRLIASLTGWANYWSIKQCDQGFLWLTNITRKPLIFLLHSIK